MRTKLEVQLVELRNLSKNCSLVYQEVRKVKETQQFDVTGSHPQKLKCGAAWGLGNLDLPKLWEATVYIILSEVKIPPILS